MAGIDFTDWKDLVGLGAAVAPSLLNRGGSTPYDNPQIQQTLALQNQRMQQAQPAFDALVSQSYGMTPMRYRGAAASVPSAGGPSFGGMSGASRVPVGQRSMQATQPSSGGGTLRKIASVASTVLPFLRGGNNTKNHPGATNASMSEDDMANRMAALDTAQSDYMNDPAMRPTPSTSVRIGDAQPLPPTIKIDGGEATLVPGTPYYADTNGRLYDPYGNPINLDEGPQFIGDVQAFLDQGRA
jgi:hypothetical protein